MPTRRQQQVADAIQKEVSVLIQRELKDPRLGFITVTRAEVSPDLHHARVFVSILGTPEEQESSMQALTSAAGFLRHELGTRLSMRYIPSIQFRSDISIAHSDRIAQLLNQLEAEGISTVSDAPPVPDAELAPDPPA